MSEHKSSKLGLGLFLGTIIGGITAFFLSPKSGKENREELMKKINRIEAWLKEKEVDKKLKEIYGEVSEEGKKLWEYVGKELSQALDEVKKRVDDFDKEKYEALVEEVMGKAQKQSKVAMKKLEKLKIYLLKQWKIATKEGKK
ncbi:hypothetical protein M1523_01325 [Patescibacteria group bacterium]|nr:hypothetical protein [Patescibacteria group bacterium]MCL5091967.1 hypothetical protein [Patescibacteria group bacterium]